MRNYQSKNYYELLRLHRDATAEQVKRAYVEIARLYHPDSKYYSDIIDDPLTEDQTEYFKHATMAYNCLSNPEERVRYDAALPPELRDWEGGASTAHAIDRAPHPIGRDFGRRRPPSDGAPSSDAIPQTASVSIILRKRRKTWWKALHFFGIERT